METSYIDNSSDIEKMFLSRFVLPWDAFQIKQKDWIAEMNKSNCPITKQWYDQSYMWDRMDPKHLHVSMIEALSFLRNHSGTIMFATEKGENAYFQGKKSIAFIAEADALALADRIEYEWYSSCGLTKENKLYEDPLPDDLYVFDNSMKWCVVFTHETTDYDLEIDTCEKAARNRYCIICAETMNYFGTDEYIKRVKALDELVFSQISFAEPERITELEDGLCVRHYYFADVEHCIPGHAPIDGEICRLYKNDEMLFEWKNLDGRSRMAKIIHHSNGSDYLVFDEDLYGYSVLDLNTLECMHYLPAESYGETPKETFIWCDCFYNAITDQLAVDGCFWASPDNVIVLDLTDPMTPVEANKWIDLYEECSKCVPDITDINVVRWSDKQLICKTSDPVPARMSIRGNFEVKFIKENGG